MSQALDGRHPQSSATQKYYHIPRGDHHAGRLGDLDEYHHIVAFLYCFIHIHTGYEYPYAAHGCLAAGPKRYLYVGT
jgi:hypothetical protein